MCVNKCQTSELWGYWYSTITKLHTYRI